MKIDALGVQAFIALADSGGFGRAAQALHITQTALSRRIQNLESHLGVKLVERTTRALSLTPIGRDFLPQARRLLTDLAAALVEIRESGKALRGNVTIACISTAGAHYLPRILQRYSALHSENRVRILDYPSERVTAAVLAREAEFGINMKGAEDPALTSIALFTDRFVLACRKDHALARRSRLRWKQLKPHRVILTGAEGGTRPLLDFTLQQHGEGIRSFYEVQRSATAVGMVAEGVGVAVLPALAVPKDAYPSLRIIPLVDPIVARALVLLSRSKAHLTPAAQALYDLVLEMK